MAHANATMDPGHPLVSDGINHTHLILIFAIILIIQTLFETRIGTLIREKKIPILYGLLKSNMENKEVDEQLNSFWTSLMGTYQKEWYCDETYSREVLGVKTLNDRAYEKLRTSRRGQKYFAETPNYDILSSPAYAAYF